MSFSDPQSSDQEAYPRSGRFGSGSASSGTSRTIGFLEGLGGDGFEILLAESALYGIPSVNIGEIGLTKRKDFDQEVSVLGSGLTAQVVRHVTDDQTETVLAPNTTVALKIFFHQHKPNDGSSSKTARHLVFDTILREVRAFGHRSLSSHPNVVQLLFIGWRMDDPFPVLAMELGQHGTLDYMIKYPSGGLSGQQKTHVTIDIALGLYAIHQAGFAHGDLKPDNILIFSHMDPIRQVVAKITDFGGSFQDCEEVGGEPVHVTPLWCAPEILNRDPDVDWEKADVYSYGLIVGSIWGGAGRAYGALEGPSSCFLTSLIPPFGLKESDVRVYLCNVKSQKVVIAALAERLTKVGTGDMGQAELLGLLTPPLQPYFWLRPDTEGLVHSLLPFAECVGRSILEEKGATISGFDRPSAYGAYADLPPEIRSWTSSAAFINIVNQQSILGIKEIDSRIDYVPITDDIPGYFTDEVSTTDFLHCLHDALMRLVSRKLKALQAAVKDLRGPDDLATKARLSILMGITSLSSQSLDREKAMEWIRDAALHGSEAAICLASFMVEGTSLESQFPMRLFLSLLALSHSTRAMQILSTRWPRLSQLIREVILERPSAYKEAGENGDIKSTNFFMSQLEPYLVQPPPLKRQLTLRESVMFGKVEEVEKMLHGTVIASDWDAVLSGLLHELSALPDEQAASLARTAYKKGAKLDHFAAVESPLIKGVLGDDLSLHSPLSSAIKRGKPLLASAIFCIHVECDVPVPNISTALELSFGLLYHEIGGMLLQLYNQNPAMCQHSPELQDATEIPISKLLSIAQSGIDLFEVERRAMHGGEYDNAYTKTLHVLLAEGLNPAEGSIGSSPLADALRFDDIISVKLYIQHLRDRGSDIVAHLEDPANLWQEGKEHLHYTALCRCVLYGSIRCLEYLLTEFPHLPAMAKDEAIHVACIRQPDTRFLSLLLASGADVMEKDSNGFASLYFALSHVSLPAADMIAEHCSEEQLRTLLCRDPDYYGRSVFSDLLHFRKRINTTQVAFQRVEFNGTPGLVRSFEWLAAHGGVHFAPYCFTEIIGQPRPSSRTDQILDLKIFEFMLDQFPYRVDTEERRTDLLHQASLNGHVDIVKLLVEQRKFNVDAIVNTDGPLPGSSAARGLTTLDLVSFNMSAPGPARVNIDEGSLYDVLSWEKDMEEIMKILAASSNYSEDFHIEKVHNYFAEIEQHLIRSGGLAELAEHLDPGAKDIIASLKRRQQSVISWPAPIPHPSSSSSSSARPEQEGARPTNSSVTARWDEIANPKVRRKRLQKRKALERVAQEQRGPKFKKKLNSVARSMKVAWRLPPHWKVIGFVQMAEGQDLERALFQDCTTGFITFEKPKLWCGEEVEPFEGKEYPEVVVRSPPTLRLRPSQEKGKQPVRE
ncbi:serine threonine protein kinase [Diplodia corticola]|uniref:Serine threonine protein kinase n=1 Tax=Diplodia corticola TaxID=236234 RepID=A0A1J9QZC5_9PEZI|nr:serine threonine protein kinase [Diplodia corticola]OJD33729.1 serine threonine protein kinase [Diplodia corticola]